MDFFLEQLIFAQDFPPTRHSSLQYPFVLSLTNAVIPEVTEVSPKDVARYC